MIAVVPASSESTTIVAEAARPANPAMHRDYLYRFALRRVGDPALADDLGQETLLAALQYRWAG